MIKLVAFDWNGTILADAKLAADADNYVLEHYGFKPIDLRTMQEQFEIPISKYWSNLGLDGKFFKEHAKEIDSLFLKYYEPKENLCRTRSGSGEVLSWLNKKKIKSVIYSNHITPHIDKQLIRFKIRNYIGDILARKLGEFNHMHEKSKDQKLKSYVHELKLHPKEVITIGDTDEEVEIGKRFGYYTVALTDGHQSIVKLRAAKPDFLIHNLNELKNIITKINGVKVS